jgi:hypothetical protein
VDDGEAATTRIFGRGIAEIGVNCEGGIGTDHDFMVFRAKETR